jgi:hypothetical protein
MLNTSNSHSNLNNSFNSSYGSGGGGGGGSAADVAAVTSSSNLLGHGHFFAKKTFHKPTYCHHCTEMLWGLIGQGFVCEGI